MFDVFKLADVAQIFIMAFRLANIYFASENSHRPRKGYSMHPSATTKLLLAVSP